MHVFQDLKIWHKAMDLVVAVYKAIGCFPKEEIYGLTSQIKRAAVSIPSNISEGAGRNSNLEFIHFLAIASGSSYELQTQLILAGRLNLLENNTLENLTKEIEEIQKMNYSLQKSIKSKIINAKPIT